MNSYDIKFISFKTPYSPHSLVYMYKEENIYTLGTELVSLEVTLLYLYLGSAWFKSWLGH